MPSAMYVAFKKQSENTGLRAYENSSESSAALSEAMDILELTPYNTSRAQKVRNLFNQGEIGKAFTMLTKTMDNMTDFDPAIAEISIQMISYLKDYAQHEKTMISDLTQTTQSYIQDGLSDISDRIHEMLNERDKAEIGIDNSIGKMEQLGDEPSEAMITAILGAMKGLINWTEEQEMLLEKLQPKRIDWFEEQQELEPKKALEFNPRIAA